MKNDLRLVTADYLGIDPNQPFEPESFVLSKRFDILGTYEAYKKFHVEEDGIPKTEDLLWTIVSTYTDWKVELTSSIDVCARGEYKTRQRTERDAPCRNAFCPSENRWRSICGSNAG